MTQTYNDPGSSKSANGHDVIDWLVRESKRYKSNEEFVDFLISQISASSHPARDLEYAVGALRRAHESYSQDQTGEAIDSRCRFCGESRSAVRTLVVSAESAICDECIVTSLETISRRRDHFYLRIPFLFFRAIASVGYSVAYISEVVTSVVYRLISKKR